MVPCGPHSKQSNKGLRQTVGRRFLKGSARIWYDLLTHGMFKLFKDRLPQIEEICAISLRSLSLSFSISFKIPFFFFPLEGHAPKPCIQNETYGPFQMEDLRIYRGALRERVCMAGPHQCTYWVVKKPGPLN